MKQANSPVELASRLWKTQLNLAWENKCAKEEAQGILCDDRPWKLFLNSKNPPGRAKDTIAKQLWDEYEQSITKNRNITVGRYQFLMRKQLNRNQWKYLLVVKNKFNIIVVLRY